jgi:hypothetical protein
MHNAYYCIDNAVLGGGLGPKTAAEALSTNRGSKGELGAVTEIGLFLCGVVMILTGPTQPEAMKQGDFKKREKIIIPAAGSFKPPSLDF